jgi:hypothetical protein
MSNMKLRKLWNVWFSCGVLALAGFFFAGCETTSIYPEPDLKNEKIEVATLRIGDTVRIEYSNLSSQPLQPF